MLLLMLGVVVFGFELFALNESLNSSCFWPKLPRNVYAARSIVDAGKEN
jgi:hypothetical protein